jgi:hypothetical protein
MGRMKELAMRDDSEMAEEKNDGDYLFEDYGLRRTKPINRVVAHDDKRR